MAKKPPTVTPPPKPREPGLYLYLRISRGVVQALKVTRIDNAPRWNLRAPLLTRETAARFERSASELVLAAVREDGTVADSFGWTADPEAIADVKSQELKIAAALLKMTDWEARWRIPMQRDVRYLQFYRTDFTRSPTGLTSFKQISLAVFDLKPGGTGRTPAMPVPTSEPPVPVQLPEETRPESRSAAAPLRKKKRAAAHMRRRASASAATAANGGFVKTSVTLLNNGDPSTKFNIVIVGDGFTNAKLSVFNAHALLVKKAFTTREPFKSLKSRINVYKVSVVSSESGVANCPTCSGAPPKNTYFQTTGCWNGTTSGTFIGTASHAKIFEAVETIIPQYQAHLVVTIVNCPGYGGSAPPELGLVFLTITDPPAYKTSHFMDLATHEAGHVIADLNEESNTCNEKDPLRPYPNEATQVEVDDKTVKWRNLALPSELDAGGQFKVIHRQGDPMDSDCQPNLSAAQLKRLGAFWGCHNGKPPGPPVDRCDPRGKEFYRPMADCRMRNIDADFCRVCSSLIAERITDVSTP